MDLPNVGAVYELGNASIFGNYAKGLSVPGTDVLYNSLFFPETVASARPVAETTDSFDLGVRYNIVFLLAHMPFDLYPQAVRRGPETPRVRTE